MANFVLAVGGEGTILVIISQAFIMMRIILLQSEGSSLNWFVMADTLFKLGSHPANPWGIMRIFIDHLQFYFFICTLYFHRQFLGRMLSRYEALLVVYIVSVRGNVKT